jgi:aspartyl-tRNA(Asn)/glutamyl-tRNA(Gln) amidotransferase subunit A
MDIRNLSLVEILENLSSKKTTSVELVEYYLSQITERNQEYNVYLSVRDKDELILEAKKADELREQGSNQKLLGVPFAIKDSFMARGTTTTAGDKYLENAMSEYNATVVEKLLGEGAILLGKTNMDGWGFGGSTQNSSYGVTKNPYDITRVAGGSSGGSGAALALKMCAFAIGEDTGGSVRNPASYCGVYGLKPTYGRISRYGCIAYASSLDSVGIFANAPEDLSLVFEILSTPDDRDMTLVRNELPITDDELKKKFAYSKDFMPEELDEEVKQAYLNTIEEFKKNGYEAVEVKFPSFEYCIPTYYITAMAEASTNLSRYNGTRYGKYQSSISDLQSSKETTPKTWEELYKTARTKGFNKEAKRRVFLGSYISSEGYSEAYYKKSQTIRNLIFKELEDVLESVDFILCPVTPTPAPEIGETSDNPVKAYLEDVYTVTANLAGIPSIAIPVSKSSSGLPIGMQVMGGKFSEENLLRILKEHRK